MNILYLTDTGDIIGGGEISLFNLLENIDREKFNPFMVMPYEGNFAEKIKILNIPVTVLPLKRIKNPFNFLFSLKNIGKLIVFIKTRQIDLVHSNSTGGIAILGGIASRIAKIPFLWHVRVISSGGLLDLVLSKLSTKIIVISEAVKKRFWWIPDKSKLARIYNGVNLEHIMKTEDKASFREQIGLKHNEFLVGTMGRYHPFKNYEYFIKAAKEVCKKLPQVKFLIVGLEFDENNEYLKELQYLTRKLEIEDKLIFMGKQDNISRVFSALDLFVLSTLREPFGRVVIEAMACQRVVVGFNGGGVPEIVEEGKTGFLAKAGDFKQMAERIIYLLENKNVREDLGKNGKERAKKLFDIKEHAKQIENLYKELNKKSEA